MPDFLDYLVAISITRKGNSDADTLQASDEGIKLTMTALYLEKPECRYPW